MDTVWMRLTLVNGMQEHFMFGPTGIVRFFSAANKTILYRSMDVQAAEVKESDEYIMCVLSKIRGTEGRLDAKQKTVKKVKRKASHSKTKRKV